MRANNEKIRPTDDKIEQWIAKAGLYSSATLHEAAGKTGALPAAIKPLTKETKLYGRVTTVQSPPGDNLWLHRAIYEAEAGTILVIDVNGHHEAGYWGEIMATAAMERKIKGLVIDGCVRDERQLIDMGFPVFSRGLCIQGTSKNKDAFGAINAPIRIEGTQIFPGDLIFGDADGCVVLPMDQVERIVMEAERREEQEKAILAELKSGKSTLEIYHFD